MNPRKKTSRIRPWYEKEKPTISFSLCPHMKVINERTEDFMCFVVPIDEQQQKNVWGHYLPMFVLVDEQMSIYMRPLLDNVEAPHVSEHWLVSCLEAARARGVQESLPQLVPIEFLLFWSAIFDSFFFFFPPFLLPCFPAWRCCEWWKDQIYIIFVNFINYPTTSLTFWDNQELINSVANWGKCLE